MLRKYLYYFFLFILKATMKFTFKYFNFVRNKVTNYSFLEFTICLCQFMKESINIKMKRSLTFI